MTPLGMQKIILTESLEIGQIGLFLDYSSNLGNDLMNFSDLTGPVTCRARGAFIRQIE